MFAHMWQPIAAQTTPEEMHPGLAYSRSFPLNRNCTFIMPVRSVWGDNFFLISLHLCHPFISKAGPSCLSLALADTAKALLFAQLFV